MTDTKENILMTALRLFARDGYEAVSVSMIAGELGMTKGALYRHYESKRAIFDSIVARMYEIDAARSQQHEMPAETYAANAAAYDDVAWAAVRSFAAAQYRFWTEDAFARDFRRMLTLEQYRSAEMAELYHNCITAGPVAYMTDIFREMMSRGILRQADPQQLALEYYAPLFLLITISDQTHDRAQQLALLERHMDRFMQHNAAEGA